jgi:hypothetical protein
MKDATTSCKVIKRSLQRWPNANIGIVTGQASGIVALDVDGNEGRQSLQKLAADSPEAFLTRSTRTRRGKHYLFRAPQGQTISNRTNILPGIDIRGDGGYVVAPPSRHPKGRYTSVDSKQSLADFPLHLFAGHTASTSSEPNVDTLVEGRRNDGLTRIAGVMRRAGASRRGIKAALLAENRARCAPPLQQGEVVRIADSIVRYSPASLELPAVLDPMALFGLAGEAVRVLEPYSEAHEAALLSQVLTFFGNACGPAAHFKIGATRHGLNLFIALVGPTGAGRKGTSTALIRELFRGVDPQWERERIQSGLTSGEGLIHAVRDSGKGDEGVSDKRLTIYEPEFGATLRVLTRDGNTLSPTLRQAFDSDALNTLAKKSPATATGAHISLVAHITKEELNERLSRGDIFSGLAPRICWFSVRRSKSLPIPPELTAEVLEPLRSKIQAAIAFSHEIGPLQLSKKARALWRNAYRVLSDEIDGDVGVLLSRATAHVLRLAAIHAVMNRSRIVKREHLRSALAAWSYCRDSVVKIFTRSSRTLRDRVLSLIAHSQTGLTRTEISRHFSNHIRNDDLERELMAMATQGLIRSEKSRTAGRPAERWLPNMRSHE